jgi:predicted nucleic acid-binding Zn ribbon protein
MALTTCKECENQISSSAEVCPHCGFTIEKNRVKKQGYIKIFAMLALLLIILFLIKLGWLEPILNNFFGKLLP